MKVLVVGSGGREHALAYKLAQSHKVSKIYAAPGNGGIASIAECVAISATDVEAICNFVVENDIAFTVVGPEAPLAAGLVDALQERGRAAFGVTKDAAQLESSKGFAKNLMKKYSIPTAAYEIFDDYAAARAYVENQKFPLVVKADGLAAGKGVIIAENLADAEAALKDILLDNAFGSAGSSVVIEEFLNGEEVSVLALCDGEFILPLEPSQDHKRALDGDKGLNTGGMGAYSPVPIYTPELAEKTVKLVLEPTIAALKSEGIIYKGIIYAGLMVENGEPKVLEFNCRFGDPETEAVLYRMESDLLEAFEAVYTGSLAHYELKWSDEPAVCVVVASGGYPEAYEKGKEISGLDNVNENEAVVFHAGTKLIDGKIFTDGGRVLTVTAKGKDIAAARDKAYAAIEKISFDKAFFRHDIAHRALK
ncbi:MAG: phosphoribosylamine--glycine ligase [Firmicutes bacterium]|nr:phosphoribosylamine--glycine ligase [Bacillota bacterium]